MKSRVFSIAPSAASGSNTTRQFDGVRTAVSLTVSPIRGDAGTIVGASKIARDITRRKRIQVALRESEQRLRLATQTGKLGVWDWDIATNHVSWSDSLYTIHGVRPDQFDGTVEGFTALIILRIGVRIGSDSARR
jgi:PAS domain-containing protein